MFSFIKYEELAANPIQVAKALYDKINITFSTNVRIFLETHTNVSISDPRNADPYGTARNSRKAAHKAAHK